MGACTTTVRAVHKNDLIEDGPPTCQNVFHWVKDVYYAFHVLSSKVHGCNFCPMKALHNADCRSSWLGRCVPTYLCSMRRAPTPCLQVLGPFSSPCLLAATSFPPPSISSLHCTFHQPRLLACAIQLRLEMHTTTTMNVKSTLDRCPLFLEQATSSCSYGACRCRLGQLPHG